MSDLFLNPDHAKIYAKYRPTTPQVVVDKIIAYLSQNVERPYKEALDVGCGTGQGTRILAPYFSKVTGTDVSQSQVQEATNDLQNPTNVFFEASTAEKIPLADASVQLITACQCFHYFDEDKFFGESRRILQNDGVLAVYGHWITLVKGNTDEKSKNIEDVMIRYMWEDLTKYNTNTRAIDMVKDLYRGVTLPMNNFVRDNDIFVNSEMPLDDYIGYISTFSHFQKLVESEGQENGRELLNRVKADILKELNIKDGDGTNPVVPVVTRYFLLMSRK